MTFPVWYPACSKLIVRTVELVGESVILKTKSKNSSVGNRSKFAIP